MLGGILLLTCLAVPPQADVRPVCEALKDYDLITATVTEKFFDRGFRGLDWPSRVAACRGRITCDMTAGDLAAVVSSLLAELKTSHTGIYTPGDLDYWAIRSIFSRDVTKFRFPFSGIWAVRRRGVWYAKNVLKGSPAEAAGVLTGDMLHTLDGRPFSPAAFTADRESVLTISSDGRNKREAKLRPDVESVQEAFLKATELSTRILRAGDRRVGYFHLWCGTHEKFLAAFNSAMEGFAGENVDALLIDIRDGFGGANPDYLRILSENARLQAVPKFFLINDGVRSGKEWISALIKRDKIGVLIGTTTAGAFVGGAPFDIRDGRYCLYLAVNSFDPPGLPKLEGVGVVPDVVVTDCRELCAGRDPQFEAALEIIRGARAGH
jgi:carboxyl-terminal processing protease